MVRLLVFLAVASNVLCNAVHDIEDDAKCPADYDDATSAMNHDVPEDAPSLLQVNSRRHIHANDTDVKWPDVSLLAGMFTRSKPHPWPQTCDMRQGGTCDITSSKFPPYKPVSVYPGGKTVCMGDSDYWFQVVRGYLKKLHIHFQGGGACWNQMSYNSDETGCQMVPERITEVGLFNKKEPANPVEGYSVIIVQYCSGDMHGGNVEQPWGENGALIQQRGAINTQAVLDYAVQQFPDIDKLVVTGSSAGSLALQLWGGYISRQFKGKTQDAVFIADSFTGISYPPGSEYASQSELMGIFNLCASPSLLYNQKCRCKRKKLLLGNLWTEAMRGDRSARFVNLNSKADATQIKFTQAYEATTMLNIWGAFMTPGDFYKMTNLLLVDWLKQPNFDVYIADGESHNYLEYSYLYTTSPLGQDDISGKPLMTTWLTELINPSVELINICIGPEYKVTSWSIVAANATHYCDPQTVSETLP